MLLRRTPYELHFSTLDCHYLLKRFLASHRLRHFFKVFDATKLFAIIWKAANGVSSCESDKTTRQSLTHHTFLNIKLSLAFLYRNQQAVVEETVLL